MVPVIGYYKGLKWEDQQGVSWNLIMAGSHFGQDCDLSNVIWFAWMPLHSAAFMSSSSWSGIELDSSQATLKKPTISFLLMRSVRNDESLQTHNFLGSPSSLNMLHLTLNIFAKRHIICYSNFGLRSKCCRHFFQQKTSNAFQFNLPLSYAWRSKNTLQKCFFLSSFNSDFFPSSEKSQNPLLMTRKERQKSFHAKWSGKKKHYEAQEKGKINRNVQRWIPFKIGAPKIGLKRKAIWYSSRFIKIRFCCDWWM